MPPRTPLRLAPHQAPAIRLEILGNVPLAPIVAALLDRHSLGALPALLHPAVQNHVDDLLPKTCVRYVYRAGSVRATTRSILATNCLRGLSALHPDRGPAKPRGPTAPARDCTEDRGRPHSLPMRPSLGPLSYFRKSEKPGRRARKSSEVQAEVSTGRSTGVSLDHCREFT